MAPASHRDRVGAIAPRSGHPRLIVSTANAAVLAQVAAHPDAMLAERRDRWQTEQPVPVSLLTMRRAFRRVNITLKKLNGPGAGCHGPGGAVGDARSEPLNLSKLEEYPDDDGPTAGADSARIARGRSGTQRPLRGGHFAGHPNAHRLR